MGWLHGDTGQPGGGEAMVELLLSHHREERWGRGNGWASMQPSQGRVECHAHNPDEIPAHTSAFVWHTFTSLIDMLASTTSYSEHVLPHVLLSFMS